MLAPCCLLGKGVMGWLCAHGGACVGTPTFGPMRSAATLGLLALAVAAAEPEDKEDKIVVSTAWWPPGSEKTAESVGILSHGTEGAE